MQCLEEPHRIEIDDGHDGVEIAGAGSDAQHRERELQSVESVQPGGRRLKRSVRPVAGSSSGGDQVAARVAQGLDERSPDADRVGQDVLAAGHGATAEVGGCQRRTQRGGDRRRLRDSLPARRRPSRTPVHGHGSCAATATAFRDGHTAVRRLRRSSRTCLICT